MRSQVYDQFVIIMFIDYRDVILVPPSCAVNREHQNHKG
jgi:hypothetical protein